MHEHRHIGVFILIHIFQKSSMRKYLPLLHGIHADIFWSIVYLLYFYFF